MAEGCVIVAPGAKGSFPSSTDEATKPKNMIALSNPHTRTTGFQGTRICMAEHSEDERAQLTTYLYCNAKSPKLISQNSSLFVIVGEIACVRLCLY
jgi:hypothetical protein